MIWLLKCNIAIKPGLHSVVRRDIYQKNPRNFRDAVTQEVLGTSVLTRYNNETYRIDDVAWDKSPKFEFERKGQKISLIDYYKVQWNLTIQDHEQPLLINRAKERTSTGQVWIFKYFFGIDLKYTLIHTINY